MPLYVDDIIISGNDVIGISDLKHYLMRTFKMKDLGVLTYFLGLEIQYTPLGIHQHKYVEDLLSITRLSHGQSADTTIEINVKFQKEDGSPLHNATMPHDIAAWLEA